MHSRKWRSRYFLRSSAPFDVNACAYRNVFFTDDPHNRERTADAVGTHTHDLGHFTPQQIRLFLDKLSKLVTVNLVARLEAGFASLMIRRLTQPHIDSWAHHGKKPGHLACAAAHRYISQHSLLQVFAVCHSLSPACALNPFHMSDLSSDQLHRGQL